MDRLILYVMANFRRGAQESRVTSLGIARVRDK